MKRTLAENRAGFGSVGQPKSDYDIFMENDGIPVFRSLRLHSVKDLSLGRLVTIFRLMVPKVNEVIMSLRFLHEGGGVLEPEKYSYEEFFWWLRGMVLPRFGGRVTKDIFLSGSRDLCSRFHSTPIAASAVQSINLILDRWNNSTESNRYHWKHRLLNSRVKLIPRR